MKKLWITLLSVLTLVLGLFGIVACGDSGDVLTNYTLKEHGTLVEADFVLPYSIGSKNVTWASNNDAIVVKKNTADWTAELHLGDEATPVTLTVTCGKEKKDFEVTVAALDVSYFVKNFNFAQDQATVYKDFELPTETQVINGKKATITWSVDRDQDKPYISIEGNTCKVTESSLNPEVRLYATFSYNGRTQLVNYRLTVSFERTHLEEVDYWYYNTGVSITMSGYVVAIATAYDEGYGNVNLYMVDDDFCAGYYLYRVKADKANAALLEPGVHVTVTGTTNTNYNGLIETNAGGTLVVDQDKAKIDVNEHIYALDNDVLAGSPAAIYHTSTLVSLTDWKVVEKAKSKPTAGNTGTLFTIEKNKVKVAIGISKYMEGVYATNDKDDTWNALVALYDTINVDDIVSVSGIFGNYNGYQIMPLKAADVVKGTEESAIPEACTKVNAAIAAVEKVFKTEGVAGATNAGYIVIADKEITVPTEVGGVEIEYEDLHSSQSVTIGEGTINVVADIEDMASIKVTYTMKDGDTVLYTTSTFHTIHSMKMDPEDVVAKVKFDFVWDAKNNEIEESIDLQTTVAEYPGVTITWKVTSGDKVASISQDGKKLLVTPSMVEDTEVKIVGEIAYGEAKVSTKEYTIKVLKADPNKYLVTSEKLGLAAYAKEGNGTVTGVQFDWIGMGDYGDGIQMRTNANTGTSSFWNASEINPIIKLVLTWSDSKDLPTKENVLKVEFANSVDFADAKEQLITFTDSKTLSVEIPEGNYTYVRITHNNQGAVYLKSVQIDCAEPDPSKLLVTSEKLNLAAYANEGNGNVSGIKFDWIGMGDYGDGIQMRTSDKTGTSSFWNATAVNPIEKLVLTWSDSKDLPTKENVLKIEFANSVDFADAKEQLITFTDSKTLEVTIPEGSYTYIRITHNNQGAVYLKSVQIDCNAGDAQA